MERNEVSIHECRVFLVLKNNAKWMTNKEIATEASVANRTASFKTKKFVDLGICDIAEVYPGHRYRLSQKADKRNTAYMKRLEEAVSIFGL